MPADMSKAEIVRQAGVSGNTVLSLVQQGC
jgi:DNA-binding CsgD family transcriptional regulator